MPTIKQIKEAQGYTDKVVIPVCKNCRYFFFDRAFPAWIVKENRIEYMKEEMKIDINLHCGIGTFRVKKQGGCKQFESRGGVAYDNKNG